MVKTLNYRTKQIWSIARRLAREDENIEFFKKLELSEVDRQYLISLFGEAIAEYDKVKHSCPVASQYVDHPLMLVRYRSKGKEPSDRKIEPSYIYGNFDRKGRARYTHLDAFCKRSSTTKTFLIENIVQAWEGKTGEEIEDVVGYILSHASQE